MITGSGFSEIAKETGVFTQESVARVKKKGSQVLIGIPREVADQEKEWY